MIRKSMKTKISRKSTKPKTSKQPRKQPRKQFTRKISSKSSSQLSRKSSRKVTGPSNVIAILKEIQNTTTQHEMARLLHEFIDSTKISNDEFQSYISQIKPLSSQGKSGSLVGTLPNMPDSIIKTYQYKINPDKLIKPSKCIRIDNKLNELLINIVIKYMPKLFKLSSNELRILKRNTLMITHYGISDNGSFIILPKIGIAASGKYITNLRELIEFNHKPILANIMKHIQDTDPDTGNTDSEQWKTLIDEYDKFITEKIANYIEVLKLFQKRMNYINSDVKMTNIFIKPVDKSIHISKRDKYQKLREHGFIVDFELVLADLEKSSYVLSSNALSNGISNSIRNSISDSISDSIGDRKLRKKLVITTFPRSPMKINVLYFIGHGLDNYIRYGCNKTLKNTVCKNKLDPMNYDPLCLLIDFYAYILRIDSRMIDFLPGIYEYYKNILGTDNLVKLVKIIKNGQYKIDKRYSFVINGIISKYCKMV